jgi:hypothetical protein
VSDETVERIATEFHNGVILYHDPAQAIVRCYVKLKDVAEEQFMAVYNGDPDRDSADQLLAFKRRFERYLDGTNWSVVRDGSENQIVYDRLGADRLSGSHAVERVERALRQSLADRPSETEIDDLNVLSPSYDGPVDFRTPNAEVALAVVAFVRDRLGESRSVAISRSGRTESLRHTDVVIRPDDEAGGIELAGRAEEELSSATVERGLAEARAGLDTLREKVASETYEDTAQVMAKALAKADTEDRLGVTVRPLGTVKRENSIRPTARVALAAGLTVALAAFLTVTAVTRDGFGADLLTAARGPFGVGVSSLGWTAAAALIVVVTGWATVFATADRSPTRVLRRAVAGQIPVPEPAAGPARTVVDALATVRSEANTEEFRRRTGRLLRKYELDPVTSDGDGFDVTVPPWIVTAVTVMVAAVIGGFAALVAAGVV